LFVETEPQVWDEGMERMSEADYQPRSFFKYEVNLNHPGVELRANLKSISHRCHLSEEAFV